MNDNDSKEHSHGDVMDDLLGAQRWRKEGCPVAKNQVYLPTQQLIPILSPLSGK